MMDLVEFPSLCMLGIMNLDGIADLDELVDRDDIAEIHDVEPGYDGESEDDVPQAESCI